MDLLVSMEYNRMSELAKWARSATIRKIFMAEEKSGFVCVWISHYGHASGIWRQERKESHEKTK